MKNVLFLLAFSFFSFTLSAQIKGKINSTINRSKEEVNKVVAPPPPKVNKATESNRKRPGGTLPNNANSKQGTPPAGEPKKPVKRD